MAKRKRLTPPKSEYLDGTPPLETKGMFPLGVARTRNAPIADVARDSSAAAALQELSETWAAAREDGLLVMVLPHDAIALNHLHRDRVAMDSEDTQALKQSLIDRGQQSPIDVVPLAGTSERYGLLSGWRRCQTLRSLYAETGDARFATVQALIRHPADARAAYRTMVEENEIRANLSHYERARVVIKAVEAGVFETEKAALGGLYGAVPRARRSKIKSFLSVVHALEGALRFPEALSERMGLDLAHRLRDTPALTAKLRAALKQGTPASADAELIVISDVLNSTLNQNIEPKKGIKARGANDNLTTLPGLTVRQTGKEGVTLSGPAMTDDLQAALLAWLQGQLKV